MAKYHIKGGKVGSHSIWNVVNDSGEIVAGLHGPMSAIVALAACESMNQGFSYDDWTKRFTDLIEKEEWDHADI